MCFGADDSVIVECENVRPSFHWDICAGDSRCGALH